jgi:hypothetical protein
VVLPPTKQVGTPGSLGRPVPVIALPLGVSPCPKAEYRRGVAGFVRGMSQTMLRSRPNCYCGPTRCRVHVAGLGARNCWQPRVASSRSWKGNSGKRCSTASNGSSLRRRCSVPSAMDLGSRTWAGRTRSQPGRFTGTPGGNGWRGVTRVHHYYMESLTPSG